MQRRVPVRVDRAQRAAGVQDQLSNVHAACVGRPVEADVELLQETGQHTQSELRPDPTGKSEKPQMTKLIRVELSDELIQSTTHNPELHERFWLK